MFDGAAMAAAGKLNAADGQVIWLNIMQTYVGVLSAVRAAREAVKTAERR